MTAANDADDTLTDATAMAAFMVGLLGLILPIIPGLVALYLSRKATINIKRANGLVGGMNFVRGAQILGVMNFFVVAGVLAAAVYLDSH